MPDPIREPSQFPEDDRHRLPRAIEVWRLEAYIGVVVLDPSGMLYTNQCGGTACSHPTARGFYIPLTTDGYDHGNDVLAPAFMPPDAHDPLLDLAWERGDSHNYIERFLRAFPRLGALLQVDRGWCREPGFELHEAWVPVVIGAPEGHWLSALNGRRAVLTYPNSD